MNKTLEAKNSLLTALKLLYIELTDKGMKSELYGIIESLVVGIRFLENQDEKHQTKLAGLRRRNLKERKEVRSEPK